MADVQWSGTPVGYGRDDTYHSSNPQSAGPQGQTHQAHSGPEPFDPGQYGQEQYGQDQYGRGQYDQHALNQGHYGQDQSETGQPGAPQADLAQSGKGMGGYVNVAGAVVSLALLVGVGVWGYQLLVRDVTGVPVVRASDGPWRVAPEDPGGSRADHQGLAVNEVAGLGTASGPVEQVALAPNSVGLQDEDVASLKLNTLSTREGGAAMPTMASSRATFGASDQGVTQRNFVPGSVTPSAVTTGGVTQTSVTPRGVTPRNVPVAVNPLPAPTNTAGGIMTNRVDTSGQRQPISNATIQALADQIAADVKPFGTTTTPTTPAPMVVASVKPIETAVSTIDGPGVRRSLRPRTRPSQLVKTSLASPVAAAPTAQAATATTAEINAATLPAGTRLVQLGAYDSAAIAQSEWGRISGRFNSFFDGKSRVIQRAESGGRTFYRLRAHGFDDLADARRFCAALVAERTDCIPVITK